MSTSIDFSSISPSRYPPSDDEILFLVNKFPAGNLKWFAGKIEVLVDGKMVCYEYDEDKQLNFIFSLLHKLKPDNL